MEMAHRNPYAPGLHYLAQTTEFQANYELHSIRNYQKIELPNSASRNQVKTQQLNKQQTQTRNDNQTNQNNHLKLMKRKNRVPESESESRRSLTESEMGSKMRPRLVRNCHWRLKLEAFDIRRLWWPIDRAIAGNPTICAFQICFVKSELSSKFGRELSSCS